MTLRHGMPALLLLIAGVGWIYSPPTALRSRHKRIAGVCLALSAATVAAGVMATDRDPRG